MILTTTSQIEGYPIKEYKGIVTGETIYGMNFAKDFFAGIRDFFGGRVGSYEKSLLQAQQESMREMEERTKSMGANAVVGIDIRFETMGAKGSMLMVSVSGTAVVI